MRQGIEYLKNIKVVTNAQIANRKQKCSKLNGGCDKCPSWKKCQKLFDDLFTEYNTYMTIETAREAEIWKKRGSQ